MKIIFFYAFIIGSVAAVAPHDRKERRDNSDTPHLRATKGSASGHATATGLFESELESDVSADGIMSVEEIELALEGLDDAQREIQLSAYYDFTQNNMSIEEISEKYLSRDTNLGSQGIYCCRYRATECGFSTFFCDKRCYWPQGTGPHNQCCAPKDRGYKRYVFQGCGR